MRFIVSQNTSKPKFLLSISLMLSLTACMATVPVKPAVPESAAERTALQNYRIGDSASASLGEAIVVKGEQVFVELSSEKLSAVSSVESGAFQIVAGEQYPVMSFDKVLGAYVVAGENSEAAVKVDKEGRLLQSSVLYLRKGQWSENSIFSVGKVGEPMFEPVHIERVVAPESARTELLYSGLTGDKLELSYREYKGAQQEPTVAQEYSFNLADHNIIRVQDFRIQIESATSSEIKYSVLTD